MNNQRLAINGVFHASKRTDAVACAIQAFGQEALAQMPQNLRNLPQDIVTLREFDMVGLPALRALLAAGGAPVPPAQTSSVEPVAHLQGLDALTDELAGSGRG